MMGLIKEFKEFLQLRDNLVVVKAELDYLKECYGDKKKMLKRYAMQDEEILKLRQKLQAQSGLLSIVNNQLEDLKDKYTILRAAILTESEKEKVKDETKNKS